MSTPDQVAIDILGAAGQVIETNHLPPVGTVFQVHKHLTDDGSYQSLKVTSHEWVLQEPCEESGSAFFSITVRTRVDK